ncbi:Fur family transcriptional regulator, peroxide stress response regulator [Desulfurobacterium pacificum]|jgi:Fur family peroxide stress response transcriptional regulator|uniref:Fur family transcriptional regulator, peroxide stress response regulator n=1 Tax=Desulfurobacterium pacificum TaxID=240166 RepID=A0ABY1NJZ6_9BACT|nr:transcriptional repressor [Desulfurobacterium pacificum]SMP11331.1 Fur family transcriptional regulator, peroxide stress response regulator [Desulfurobacterium pacificum]
MEERILSFREKARKAGLKLTPQRLAVYKELISRTDHPGAEELYESLKEKIEGISLTTIYRTLASLERAGLVIRVPTLRDKVRYDARTEPHSHFVCLECGRVYDMDCDFKENLKLSEIPEGFEVKSCSLVCYGICKECNSSNK